MLVRCLPLFSYAARMSMVCSKCGTPAVVALSILWRLFCSAQHGEVKVHELMLGQSSAPGAIAPTFSPDGRSVVYGKSVGAQTFLFQIEKSAGRWGVPRVASFSGQYTDIEPAFAPDGKYIIFSSNRPLPGGTALADGNYDGKVRPGHGGHLWRVDRRSTGWGEPFPLPALVNATDSTFSPSISGDGTLYFMRPVNVGDKFHLYSSRLVKGDYAAPERVSFSNLDGFGDFDPAVARDASFLIFSSSRPPSLPHRSDLFIVYRTHDAWSSPVDLRSLLTDDVFGVEARLSPHEKTLYFTNTRRLAPDPPESPEHPFVQHTWEVDGTALEQSLRNQNGDRKP
jgi:hypothetical protein